MTYEERIAAAQAKMDTLKATMAAAADKAKAADAAAEYVEKYGEPVTDEIPEKAEAAE